MPLYLALILAIFQGVAEFLPISSSGHLRILEAVSGIGEPQMLFDVMLHLGTLVAVIWVYRELLGRMLYAVIAALRAPSRLGASYRESPDFRLFVLTCLGMVPTTLIALALAAVSREWTRSLVLVGCGLLITSLLLTLLGRMLGRRKPEEGRDLAAMTWRDALIIGTFQGGSAAFRGVSRSGSTITAGVLVGLRQDAAAAFSFMLSIPAIMGALVLALKDTHEVGDVLVPGLIGAVVAAAVGILALKLLLTMLGRGRLGLFAIWTAAVGIFAIVWALR